MIALQKIVTEYTKLRSDGLEVKASLNVLRNEIQVLDEKEKQDLVRLLRAREAGETGEAREAQPTVVNNVAAKAVSNEPDRKPSLRSLAKERQLIEPVKASEVTWINCPNCGHSNQKHELVCYSCGQLLESSNSQQETHALSDTNDLTYSEDFFDQDSVLTLKVRLSGRLFLAEPQKSDHDLIIGRSATGSPVTPDIDLIDEDGDKLGVSRLHLNVSYDARSHTICISDLGSANGTYINGQRLHPHEVRVLRDHDEVRLGKLVLLASFRRQ